MTTSPERFWKMAPAVAAAVIAASTALITLTVNNWTRIFPPAPPRVSGHWTYKMASSPDQLESELNLISPSPDNLSTIASGPNLHYWYRGGGTGTRYTKRIIAWRAEEHPDGNFFHQDHKTVPGGFLPNGIFLYLEVTTPPHSE